MTEENNFNQEIQNTALPGEENFSGSEPPENQDGGQNFYTPQQPFPQPPVQPAPMPPTIPAFDPVEYKEKNDIKAASNLVGGAMLAMTGVVLLFNIIALIAFTVAKGSFTEALELMPDPALSQVQQILFSITAFTVPFILVFKFSHNRISDLLSFSAPKAKTALPFFLFGIAFCAFANIASSVAQSIFESADIDYEVTMPENPSGFFGFMLALISTVIVPALVEEFACRGILMGYLRKFGDGFAVIASAAVFGLMHGNFEQMPFAFLVGLVLGYITVKSGTIVIAMAVHAFNNSISVIFEYLLSGMSVTAQNVLYTVFLAVCMLLGIAALFLFDRKDSDVYKFKPSQMQAPQKKKLIWFFTSVPMVIYICICIFESLQFFTD